MVALEDCMSGLQFQNLKADRPRLPVQLLGHGAELNQEVAGQVLRLNLAPLFLPEPEQRRLVVPHDGPGVRAADEGSAVGNCVGKTTGHWQCFLS
jgi:hypothetical protein